MYEWYSYAGQLIHCCSDLRISVRPRTVNQTTSQASGSVPPKSASADIFSGTNMLVNFRNIVKQDTCTGVKDFDKYTTVV